MQAFAQSQYNVSSATNWIVLVSFLMTKYISGELSKSEENHMSQLIISLRSWDQNYHQKRNWQKMIGMFHFPNCYQPNSCYHLVYINFLITEITCERGTPASIFKNRIRWNLPHVSFLTQRAESFFNRTASISKCWHKMQSGFWQTAPCRHAHMRYNQNIAFAIPWNAYWLKGPLCL